MDVKRAGFLAAALAVCVGVGMQAQAPRRVDDAMLLKAPVEEWVSYGRDYAETHHSPLAQIDASDLTKYVL